MGRQNKGHDFRGVKGYSISELARNLNVSAEQLLSVVDHKILTRFQERGFDVVIAEKIEDSIIGLKAARLIGKKFFKEEAKVFIDALEVHLILEAHDNKIRREFNHHPLASESEKKSHTKEKTMSENTLQPVYVAPSPKAELGGKEGLYADEIAISLGIPPKKVRYKLESEGFLDLLKEYNFDTVRFRTPNKSNGIEFTEYALETIAAKFFVAKYNNKQGNGYLIYLLALEAFVEKQEGMTSKLEYFCQTDPICSLHLQGIKERKRVLERREAQDQKYYASLETSLTRNLPESSQESSLAKKSSRRTTAKSKNETISVRKMSQDYFYGLGPHVINRYLISINHGKKGSMWLREGIEFAARRFFKDVTFDRHIEDKKLNVYYYKPIGFYFGIPDHIGPLPISNN